MVDGDQGQIPKDVEEWFGEKYWNLGWWGSWNNLKNPKASLKLYVWVKKEKAEGQIFMRTQCLMHFREDLKTFKCFYLFNLPSGLNSQRMGGLLSMWAECCTEPWWLTLKHWNHTPILPLRPNWHPYLSIHVIFFTRSMSQDHETGVSTETEIRQGTWGPTYNPLAELAYQMSTLKIWMCGHGMSEEKDLRHSVGPHIPICGLSLGWWVRRAFLEWFQLPVAPSENLLVVFCRDTLRSMRGNTVAEWLQFLFCASGIWPPGIPKRLTNLFPLFVVPNWIVILKQQAHYQWVFWSIFKTELSSCAINSIQQIIIEICEWPCGVCNYQFLWWWIRWLTSQLKLKSVKTLSPKAGRGQTTLLSGKEVQPFEVMPRDPESMLPTIVPQNTILFRSFLSQTRIGILGSRHSGMLAKLTF